MTKVFAHRGFSGKYPENTMLAFEKAVEENVDGIELDVQLTKDGIPVIIHDETVDRTTNGKGYIKDMLLSEVKTLDASYIYTGKMGVNKIPTLDEYLDFIKKYPIVTNIELKSSIILYEGIEEKTLELIKKHNVQDKIIISNFNHYSLLRMKKLSPSITCGFLVDGWIINPGKYCKQHGVEGYHPEYHNLTEEIMAELKAENIQSNPWTVNDENDIRDLVKKGATSVIGNFPDLAKKIVSELK